MFDLQLCTTFVEGVLVRRLLGFAGEAVCEWASVVGEQVRDLYRRGLVQAKNELAAAGFGLVHIAAHEHLACGSVNGREKLMAAGLLEHLWQVFDVIMHNLGLLIYWLLAARPLPRLASRAAETPRGASGGGQAQSAKQPH